MRRSLVLLLACIGSLSASAQQPATPLHGGQSLTLDGVLQPAHAGRLQFMTVQSHQRYRGADGKRIDGIALSGYPDYARLYALRGKQVSARGTLLVEDASPYYWNGVLLKVNTLHSADGQDLLQPTAKTAVAADVGMYSASVILPADPAAPWQYSARGQADMHSLLHCSSNGGGDIVNCACASGFHATAAHLTVAGKSTPGDLTDPIAQFSVGEDLRRMTLDVTCSR